MPRMITLKQAATETGLSYDCLRKLCLTGKLVHIRAGTKYLINAEKLTEYLGGDCNEQRTIYPDMEYLELLEHAKEQAKIKLEEAQKEYIKASTAVENYKKLK